MKLRNVLSSLKKVTRTTTVKVKTTVDTVNKKMLLKKREDETKMLILMRFSKQALEEIAALKRIPTYKVVGGDPFMGGGKKVKITKKTELVKLLASRLSLETIKRYAKFYHVKYEDLIYDLEKYKAKIYGLPEPKKPKTKSKSARRRGSSRKKSKKKQGKGRSNALNLKGSKKHLGVMDSGIHN